MLNKQQTHCFFPYYALAKNYPFFSLAAWTLLFTLKTLREGHLVSTPPLPTGSRSGDGHVSCGLCHLDHHTLMALLILFWLTANYKLVFHPVYELRAPSPSHFVTTKPSTGPGTPKDLNKCFSLTDAQSINMQNLGRLSKMFSLLGKNSSQLKRNTRHRFDRFSKKTGTHCILPSVCLESRERSGKCCLWFLFVASPVSPALARHVSIPLQHEPWL